MTIERLFVSRWVAAASLLCLLLLVAAGGWFYQAEATSAEEKARQQLAVLAEIKAGQIETGRQRMLADGMLLSGDSQFVATVDTFLQDSRREDAVLNLLQSHMKHGQYAVILVVDTIGTIRLHLGEANVHCLHLHHAITQALADFQPVLIQPQTGATDESALVGVVTPIVRTDQHQEQRLGAVVLLRVTDRFFGALLGLRQESTEAPQTMLVHRDEQGVLLAQDAPMRDTFGLKRLKLQEVAADSLVGLAVANQVGLVRGRNLQGEESLGFIVRIPAMESWLIVAEPVERIFSLWRYRAAVLLFIFAGAVGLISLLWQCSRKAYYKALYGAEARLRRSLEHQAILLQAIGDGVIATDQDGLIELINPMAEQLTGWSSAEALGRPLGDVFTVVTIPGQEAPACSSKGKEKEGSPADRLTHLLLIARDGRELTITALTAPFCNDRGKRVGTVLTFQDRSTEYQTRQWVEARLLLREYAYTHGIQELLHRATQELATLLESPRGFCYCLQAPTFAVAVERSIDVGEEHPWSWYDAESAPICTEIDQWINALPGRAMIHDGVLGTDEPEESCRFGAKREILLPIHRAGRRIVLLAVADKARPYSSRDVETMTQMGEYICRLMEQKQMEEELLASERRYRSLYRSMMDAFVVTDLQGRIRECNQAYAAMLGYSPDEVKGRFARDFTPEHWQEFEQEQVRKQLMQGGCSELYEKEYRHRSGSLIPVELRTFLLVDNEGQPEGMSAVVRDISLRKAAEQEQANLRDRLNQAQRLESVGQLAGGVAHDFNNMLSVIIGYAELALRQSDIPKPLEKYLQEIVKAGKRSADVTRQLLAFARRQNIVPKVLDLNATLEGMLKMLRRLIGEDVELIWLPGKDIWPVRMDPSQMDQLLANLCVNARDAISNIGKITIETGRISFDEAYCKEREGFIPGDFVMLAVSDTGSGIDRDILDKIFEPFFTTKAVGQGTGLGLATVYGIVKQNNGFINVYSEPGQGTTFRIYLPRQEGEAEVVLVEDSLPLPLGNGEIVLVVEDEASMLHLNRIMLEQLNYTVLTASTPREALQLAREYGQAIKLVITDVIMPEMNGRDLARAISECCPNVKTLFISGYTANVIAHRGELDPGVHFIPKPFSTRELSCAIQNSLLAKRNAD